MRNLEREHLNRYRVVIRDYERGDHGNGAFAIPSPIDGQTLSVIASDGGGWDHVSVSRSTRCPNWPEMEHIRRLFFQDTEAVMQLHPPIADYVDGRTYGHPYCLHLWRPQRADIPRPPKWMVGGMSPDEADAAARADGV